MELANVQSVLEILDPKVEHMESRLDEHDEFKNKLEGSLRILIWMNGIIMGLVVIILGSLFTWGLEHVTFRVVDEKPAISQSPLPQDSGLPTSYAPH